MLFPSKAPNRNTRNSFLKSFATIVVNGKVHIDLYHSKGVLFYRNHELDDISEEEIQSELASQRVAIVKRITVRRDENIKTDQYISNGIWDADASTKHQGWEMKCSFQIH